MVMVTVTEEEQRKSTGAGEMEAVKNKKRKDHQGRAMLGRMGKYKMNLWDEC